METTYDVLIIGAGLSGIGTACHLAMHCPDKKVRILERRNAMGGTWDLFRYPGVRSDSDMASFSYNFRPWNELKTLADGPSIKRYIEDAAREHGVDKKIQFGIRIAGASWSSTERCWQVHAVEEGSGTTRIFTCKYLINCGGYYNHDQGHLPEFPGVERFKGLRVHPQHWPDKLDYRGKRVVVIGSGATAVTLLPAMAEETAHITMLQRSPTYVFSLPSYDKPSAFLMRFLPKRWVFRMVRNRNIFVQRLIYKAARRWPKPVRSVLLSGVRKQVGKDVDMRHFTPSYNPWEERLAAVPDADLFKAIRDGKASVVTDHIETFTEKGILLKSGKELEADIVITATGLQLQPMGGMKLEVDGEPQHLGNLMTYKAVMLQNIPNMAYVFGYTNAAWTLKSDIAAIYICRLLKYMDGHGLDVVTARAAEGEMQSESVMGALRSGYVQRGQGAIPRQGLGLPWRVQNAYEVDRALLVNAPIEDAALEFHQAQANAAKQPGGPRDLGPAVASQVG